MKHILDRPIIGKILILSRRAAKEFVYDQPWAAISIASHSELLPNLNCVQRIDLLQLIFEDLEHVISVEEAEEYYRGPLFNTAQASQILQFAKKVWPHIDLLMIHCYAGISRSSAVGKFLSTLYQPEYVSWFDQLYSPNRLVFKTLQETLEQSREGS